MIPGSRSVYQLLEIPRSELADVATDLPAVPVVELGTRQSRSETA